MDNNELLIQSIQKMELKDAKRIIMRYLYLNPNLDSVDVTPITNEILEGNLKRITNKNIVELLNDFGHTEIKFDRFDRNEIKQVEKHKEQNNDIQDLYNTNLIELEILRENNKKLKEQKEAQDDKVKILETKLDELNNKVFKLFNLTQKGMLKEVSNDSIDELYIEYLTKGTKKLKDAFVTQKEDGKLIIPKTYFEL